MNEQMVNMKTYYFKDRITKKYICVLNGVKNCEKSSKKEAEIWYQAHKFEF